MFYLSSNLGNFGRYFCTESFYLLFLSLLPLGRLWCVWVCLMVPTGALGVGVGASPS